MAPGTAHDPWLAGRHFGIVIDAGSSGSRLQIYSWKDPRTINLKKGSELAYTLPKVEKGTKDEESWVRKVEPGASESHMFLDRTMNTSCWREQACLRWPRSQKMPAHTSDLSYNMP